MTTAIVTLGIGQCGIGAKVLHASIRRLSNTSGVEFIILDDCDIPPEYQEIKVNERWFHHTAKKLFALTLRFDRIIMLDADMLCVQDCSHLWSERFGRLPFYAVRDTASWHYYGERIAEIGLDRNLIFNGGTMVYNRRHYPELHNDLMNLIQYGICQSYDGGDQGYLNHFLQWVGIEVGYLPNGLNYVLDQWMPQFPEYERYIVHYTGSNAKPWNKNLPNDWRTPYFDLWSKEQLLLTRTA